MWPVLAREDWVGRTDAQQITLDGCARRRFTDLVHPLTQRPENSFAATLPYKQLICLKMVLLDDLRVVGQRYSGICGSRQCSRSSFLFPPDIAMWQQRSTWRRRPLLCDAPRCAAPPLRVVRPANFHNFDFCACGFRVGHTHSQSSRRPRQASEPHRERPQKERRARGRKVAVDSRTAYLSTQAQSRDREAPRRLRKERSLL